MKTLTKIVLIVLVILTVTLLTMFFAFSVWLIGEYKSIANIDVSSIKAMSDGETEASFDWFTFVLTLFSGVTQGVLVSVIATSVNTKSGKKGR